MKMPSTFTVGWIDTTIHDFLSEIDEPRAGMTYALVTCLDSSFDVATLGGDDPGVQALRLRGKAVGDGIFLTTRRLLAIERESRIFFGFDEVWFFSHHTVSAKPKRLVMTGPGKLSPESVEPFARWLERNGCSLGLGDGTGMNFCARLQGVAKHLVESLAASDANVAHRAIA